MLSTGGLGWIWGSLVTKETHPHPSLPLEGEGENQYRPETKHLPKFLHHISLNQTPTARPPKWYRKIAFLDPVPPNIL